MSADNPSDDELEREAMRDVPLAMGGSIRHAPKLGTESRAVNLRDMRELLEHQAHPPSAYSGPQSPAAMLAGFQSAVAMLPREQRYTAPEQRPRSPLAPRAPQQPQSPTTPVFDSWATAAWTSFAAAALPLCVGHDDPEGAAATIADRLLEELRRRQG